MLKKAAFSPAQPWCAKTHLSPSFVLVSLDGLFEHPAWCAPVIPNLLTNEIPACPQSFSATC
jgi:hypothetical protein